jgi:two-component system, LytTR family, response regulator
MSNAKLRVIIADDERPARSYLAALVRSIPDVEIIGEATTGTEAVQLIEEHGPDVALLDLQMPEVDGLGVVRLVRRSKLPLVIFVTAYDEYALKAFELNAVDYLLKPVDEGRLREALRRAQERLERQELRESAAAQLRSAADAYDASAPLPRLDRIPVRLKHDFLLLPVASIIAIVADGELLHLTTQRQERHTITYRLKDLEARLDPDRFVRLGRGTLVAIDAVTKITPMPGGLYTVTLQTGQQLDVSRIQSRILRERVLKL